MAEKIFLQTFEDFEGLDYRSTPLTDSLKGAQQLTNYQHSEGRSVRGRNGIQGLAQAGAFIGTHDYSYFDSTTGATVQELLAINDNLWKLSSASLGIAVVTGSPIWSWTVRVNSATNTFRFVLNQNGVPVTLVHPVTGASNAYLDLGTGLEGEDIAVYNPSLVTIWDLYQAIDATASYSIAVPPSSSARVNGIQNNVNAIVVDAGHTIAVNDVITLWDYSTSKLVARTVTATAAALITFSATYGTVSVKDNQVIGKAAAPATSLLVRDTTTGTGGFFLTYYYWDWIRHKLPPGLGEPFAQTWANRNSTNFIPPVFNNTSQACLITAFPSDVAIPAHHEGFVWKYDGNRVYRAGLPEMNQEPTINTTGAGAIAAGTYKNKWVFSYKDARGITNYGVPTANPTAVVHAGAWSTSYDITPPVWNVPSTDRASISANSAAGNTMQLALAHSIQAGDVILFQDSATGLFQKRNVVSVTRPAIAPSILTFDGATATTAQTFAPTLNYVFKASSIGMDVGSALVNGAQNNVTVITVFAGHTLNIGDILYILDTSSGLGVTRTVTAFTATTITISGGAVAVANAQRISVYCVAELYRTKAGGNIFYKVGETAVGSYDTLGLFLDNTPDANLGQQLIEPPTGRERNPPPRAAVSVDHQGSTVYTRIFGQPNTIAYSLPGEPESVPLASNYFDISSTVVGPITAAYPDTETALAVFKENAYYSVDGDLDTYSFTIKTVKQGDYGISSQSSIQKILDTIIGVGKLGIVSIRGGALISDTGNNVDPAIWGNPNIRLSQAVSCNDYVNRQYRCYIPGIEGTSVAATVDNSLMFILDYANEQQFFDWNYNPGFAPSGGFAINSNVVYHMSKSPGNAFGSGQFAALPGHLYREYKDLSDTSLYYWDNHLAPTYTYVTEWESLGEPSINKEFLRLKIYSFPGPYETRANFDLAVTTYRDYQLTTPDSQFTLSFSASTDYEKFSKLKAGKARGLAIKMVTNTGGQAPFISGIELLVAASYFKEDIAK